jgi:hypothetical protein
MICSIPECQNIPERNGICSSHNRAARKAESDALKPKKVYRIPKRSDKKIEDDKVYSKLRKEYLIENPICQIRLQCCTFTATEIHHTESRGIRINKVESFLSSCPECHRFLHDKLSAKEARDKGLKI